MFYTKINQDFSEIKILSDVNPDTKVLIYKDLNGNIISQNVLNGTQTINGETYITLSDCEDLIFTATPTNIGTRYIFDLNETTTGKFLIDGVYEIILISDTETTVLNVFLYYTIQCCLAKTLSKPYCKQTEINKIINITAIIEATQAAVNTTLFEKAVCGFKMLENYCKDCDCK